MKVVLKKKEEGEKERRKSERLQRLKEFFGMLRTHKMGMVGLVITLGFIFFAIFGPIIYTRDPNQFGEPEEVLIPPNSRFLLGTDMVGRDVFSQLIYGSRVSILIAVASGIIAITIGSIVGLIAGYYGGKVDQVLMRMVDMLMVIPNLPLIIILAVVLGPSLWNLIFVIAIMGWTGTARVVRAQTLSIKERPFVEAARSLGAGDASIMLREILPNLLPIILAYLILRMGSTIYMEATLSFLGLGDPTHVSWGMMLHFAFTSGSMSTSWWWTLPPGIAISILLLGYTFLGNAVNEILNPRFRMR